MVILKLGVTICARRSNREGKRKSWSIASQAVKSRSKRKENTILRDGEPTRRVASNMSKPIDVKVRVSHVTGVFVAADGSVVTLPPPPPAPRKQHIAVI